MKKKIKPEKLEKIQSSSDESKMSSPTVEEIQSQNIQLQIELISKDQEKTNQVLMEAMSMLEVKLTKMSDLMKKIALKINELGSALDQSNSDADEDDDPEEDDDDDSEESEEKELDDDDEFDL